MSRFAPLGNQRAVQPHLPIGPLIDWISAHTPIDAAHQPGEGLAGFGWGHKSWQRKAFDTARRQGWLTVWAADRLACDLGVHPSQIWGFQWWQAAEETA